MKKSLSLLLTFFLFTIKLNAIENISINRETLVPDFSKETRVYNVYVLSSTEIITINATGEENELITGTGSKSLKKGLNVFEINVTLAPYSAIIFLLSSLTKSGIYI